MYKGEMDSKIAAHLKSRFKSVQNVVLEPAAKQLEMYRSLVENKKSDFLGIEFDLRQLGIDEYRAQEGDQPRKFHFISAIHSLYYAQDQRDTIRYLYDRLEEGGILLVIVVSDDSGFWRLWGRYARFQDSVSRYICTTHLRDSFSSLGVPFDENRQSSRVDITSCFEEGSEDGELIIDFLTHTVDLRGTAPAELYKEVVDYIGSEQCSERKEDGEIDTKMAAHLKSRFNSVRNVVLEPAVEQVEMYRSLVGSKSEEFRGIEFDLRQLGIDEYRAQEGDQPSKYHLISAFHSIYYAQDHKDTIRYLYDCLEEGGVLLITVLAVDGGLWRIWDRFTIFQDGVTRHICTSHLREIFSSLAIPFEESRQSANLDVTSCFQEGSEDGELIIDFLTHTVDLRPTAPPVLYQNVVDFLRSDQCSTRLKDGTVLMNNDWDAFIAQKPLMK